VLELVAEEILGILKESEKERVLFWCPLKYEDLRSSKATMMSRA
jgi:hypothetical protein